MNGFDEECRNCDGIARAAERDIVRLETQLEEKCTKLDDLAAELASAREKLARLEDAVFQANVHLCRDCGCTNIASCEHEALAALATVVRRTVVRTEFSTTATHELIGSPQ